MKYILFVLLVLNFFFDIHLRKEIKDQQKINDSWLSVIFQNTDTLDKRLKETEK